MLEAQVPKLKLRDGYAHVEPDRVSKLWGLTLLWEALVLKLTRHVPFAVQVIQLQDQANVE
jgi:hypothetical protein